MGAAPVGGKGWSEGCGQRGVVRGVWSEGHDHDKV